MKNLVVAAVAVSLLTGCSTLKKVTGQTNDTVLPGAREEILPQDQQTARDPAVTGQQAPSVAETPITQAPAQKPMVAQQPEVMTPEEPQAATPNTNVAATDPNCDPNVDLCPEALPDEPLPPPSKPLPEAEAKKKKAVAATPTTPKKKLKKPVKKT